jgi:hypothetical protein
MIEAIKEQQKGTKKKDDSRKKTIDKETGLPEHDDEILS